SLTGTWAGARCSGGCLLSATLLSIRAEAREVTNVIRAQIVGATGYGGVGMVELLLRHPEIRVTSLLAISDVGKPLSAFYPHLRGYCDQVVEEAKPDRVGEDTDLVIFSTPDRVGMGYANGLVERGLRVLDYSGDFRFETPALYEWYAKAHP